ncbi:helix-turn-helix domain-containing protein [Samsonia erythrinae]|uniref:Arabinose operon regulatory protein n=1 Tax=Samsonia erythrinae TaxID=160434 RepID=A0A4R3VND5_9GAMM|nr:helix-turn-helix domain-containing protein [Samsonia erythrinae]TCV08514.1 AraC family L-rhamnose operon regulatory protein RhaS [Samsonia erythrinae]
MTILSIDEYFTSPDKTLSRYISDPEDNNKEHGHDFHELVIVDSGHGLQVINGNPIFIQSGDVFFVSNKDYHFYDELGNLKLINLLLNPNVDFTYLSNMYSLLNQLDARKPNQYGWLSPTAKFTCKSLIDNIFNISPSYSDHTFQQESLFFQLVSTILTQGDSTAKGSTKYKIHKLLGYLQENYFSNIDWEALSGEYLLTQRTIYRQIKEVTGLTPENYLKRLRLASGRVMVRETEKPITEIAFICGFSNSNHFTTAYKQAFNLTPSEDRRSKC